MDNGSYTGQTLEVVFALRDAHNSVSHTVFCLLRGRNSRNVVGQRSDAVTVATARHPPSGGGGGHRGGGSVRLSAAVHDSSMRIESFVL